MNGLVLGLSAFGHDSAAVLLRDGVILAAAQEERFTRRKFEAGFPAEALRWCLHAAGIGLDDVGRIAVFGKGAAATTRRLQGALVEVAGIEPGSLPLLAFVDRHECFAAAAFLPGPFEQAGVLCLDGGKEGTTTSAWQADGTRLQPLWRIDAPHSLGLLYSAVTGYCGFRVGSGEYKLMGLAPYGEPRFAALIRERLITVAPDGQFRLATEYFDLAAPTLTNARFHALFDGPPRTAEGPLAQRHMDLARSVQAVLEEVVLRLGHALGTATKQRRLCMAGRVALNCVANSRLLRDGPFDDIWVQPAAGDASGALGAALAVTHADARVPRAGGAGRDAMQGALLGPSFAEADIKAALTAAGARWTWIEDDALFATAARLLADGCVLGWVQGRMEFGPRALGARSILADPRHPGMQSLLNRKVKFRESFRPFAPAVLADRARDWFAGDRPSPYMLFTRPLRAAARLPAAPEEAGLEGLDRLSARRSLLPAITHVDYSARLQTVAAETHPRFARLLDAFAARTGCPVLVNTSFNVRGEPIVCTPVDAYACFMRTDIDALVVGNALMLKRDQPERAIGAETPLQAD